MAKNMEIKFPALPGVLEEIRLAVGNDMVLKFIAEYGGIIMSFPRAEKVNEQYHLSKLVGIDNARLICEIVGGGNVEVPTANVEITSYFARLYRIQGKSRNEIVIALRKVHGIRVSSAHIKTLTKHIPVKVPATNRLWGRDQSWCKPSPPASQ